MRRHLVLGVLTLLLVWTAGCGKSEQPGQSAQSTTTTSTGDTGDAVPPGWAAFADLIPESAIGESHSLVFLDTTRLEPLGFTRPPDGSDELVPYLMDVSYGFGATQSFDGMACDGCASEDDYGAAWADAMGYEPLGFDRIVLVGDPPAQLAILLGGVDPDEVAKAFEGDEHYTVTEESGTVRVSNDCEPLAVRCEDPSVRDRLGRGLNIATDGTWTAISYDPALVDDVVRLRRGAGELPDDAVERTVLDWADDLDLLAGTGWVPGGTRSCPSAAETDLPTATAAVLGTARSADVPEVADLAYRVGFEKPADAAEAEQVLTTELAGPLCSTGAPFSELLDDVAVTTSGDQVTVTAQIIKTVDTGDSGPTVGKGVNGGLWMQLDARLDLPFSDRA